MHPKLNQKLEAMAEKSNLTKSEVLRFAIALYEVALEAKERGMKIGIARKDQILEKEIVGF